jgi:hypothetical protein
MTIRILLERHRKIKSSKWGSPSLGNWNFSHDKQAKRFERHDYGYHKKKDTRNMGGNRINLASVATSGDKEYI